MHMYTGSSEGCLEYMGVSWVELKLIVFFRSRTKGQKEPMHIHE